MKIVSLLVLLCGCLIYSCNDPKPTSSKLEAKCLNYSIIKSLPSSDLNTNYLSSYEPSSVVDTFSSPKNFTLIKWKCDGFWHFTLWNNKKSSLSLLINDSIPIVEYLSDSIGRINNDQMDDFLIKGKYINGRYQNEYAILYCSVDSSSFMNIASVNKISNPSFFSGGVKGFEQSDSVRHEFFYTWKDQFHLEVDSVTQKLVRP